MKHVVILAVLAGLLFGSGAVLAADEVEVLGVKMPKTKVTDLATSSRHAIPRRWSSATTRTLNSTPLGWTKT